MARNNLVVTVKIKIKLWDIIKLRLLKGAVNNLSTDIFRIAKDGQRPMCNMCGCSIMHNDWHHTDAGTFCPLCWDRMSGTKKKTKGGQ